MSGGATKESAVARAVASVIENPAPLTRQEFEGYIDKRECARRLGRTPRSVDTYMEKGIIPFYKLGKTVAFKWSEVDAHLKKYNRIGTGGR